MEEIPESVRDPLFAGPPAKAEWMAHLTKSDWAFDGWPIRGEVMVGRFESLDWSKAWLDMGPSVSGNLGPYWHVPLVGDDETIHRLYPKLLQTKWFGVVRQAIEEAVDRERERCAKVAEAEFDPNTKAVTSQQHQAGADIAAAIRSGAAHDH